MKILVVDDSKAMRAIVRRTLGQAGYTDHEFLEAANGVEGLSVVAAHGPDLILSDWNMPEMDGLEMLKRLRADGNSVTFGFVTSEGTPDAEQQAIGAGAEFLLTKPFSADKFKAAIEGAMAA